jgi:hypothetical protein
MAGLRRPSPMVSSMVAGADTVPARQHHVLADPQAKVHNDLLDNF